MRTHITTKHFAAPVTPLLDREAQDDGYLAELASRVKTPRIDEAWQETVFDWIN